MADRLILEAICNWRVHRRGRADELKSGTAEGSVSDRFVCLTRGLCQDGRNEKRSCEIDGKGRAIKKEKSRLGDRIQGKRAREIRRRRVGWKQLLDIESERGRSARTGG